MPNESVYLGIDFGTKRIGLSVGQSITQTASPLATLSTSTTFWENFSRLVQEWQPKGFVVGLALQPEGEPSKTSQQASEFGRHLAKRYRLPVYYIEERLTSVEARNRLKENPTWAKHHDKDAVAAAIILESWLQSACEEYE